MIVCVCVYISISISLFFTLYIENHKLTAMPLNPVQYHRLCSSFLPFCICNPFSNSEKTSFHNSSNTYLRNQPHFMQPISHPCYDPLPHTDAFLSLLGPWLPCVETFSPCSGWFLMLFCLPSLTGCSLHPPWTLIFSNLALSHLMALEMNYSGRGRSTSQVFPCNVFLILFNPELSSWESKRNHQGPKERRNWEPKW